MEELPRLELPPFNDVFRDQTIFFTGATGFLGKVTLEKLLHALPSIKAIFILIRDSRKGTVEERWEEIKQSLLFARVRRDCPSALEKVVLMKGDLSHDNFGLYPGDLKRIEEEATSVIHCAATIKFNDTLKNTAELNIRGVARMLEIVKRIRNLKCFLHCSTAYSNCDRMEIEEKVYEPPVYARKLLDALEWMDDSTASALATSLVGKKINIYCMTKGIAESLVAEEARGLPALIFRPSIITGIWKDGTPGWVEGMHGFAALVFASGKAALGTMPSTRGQKCDYIPVDIVSNMMIAAVAYRCTLKSDQIPVMHCTSGALNALRVGVMCDVCHTIFTEHPMEETLGIPNGAISTDDKIRPWHRFRKDFVGPAMDTVGGVFGAKPFWRKVYQRIYEMYDVISPFTFYEWHMANDSIPLLVDSMTPEDRETFDFDVRHLDWEDHLFDFCLGVKRFLANEDVFDQKRMDAARTRIWRMRVAKQFFVLLFCYLIAAFVMWTPFPLFSFIALALGAHLWLNTEAGQSRPIKSFEQYCTEQRAAELS